jgi:hypothetical protein
LEIRFKPGDVSGIPLFQGFLIAAIPVENLPVPTRVPHQSSHFGSCVFIGFKKMSMPKRGIT